MRPGGRKRPHGGERVNRPVLLLLVRSMLRIKRIVLIALLVMRFVAERLLHEAGWTKRLIERDERFPKPIKVYLFPQRRDWGLSDGESHPRANWFGLRHSVRRTGGAMN